MLSELTNKKRCFGSIPDHELYAYYHDNEWGIPEYDDTKLFEMLVLEGGSDRVIMGNYIKKATRVS